MKISVRQHGGVLGLARETAVEGRTLLMAKGTGAVAVARLDEAQEQRLEELATLVADEASTVRPSETKSVEAVDARTTVIHIDDGNRRVTLCIGSGDEVGDAVWDLVEALESCADKHSLPEI
ncbi:MAG: hypothetical protein M3276_04180 [Actinomycetota bacterium]|nr:hypothetical protein [Actinomycetota bacterium]